MKKALFAIAISLVLAACGDDSSSNADDNSSTVIDTAIESDSSSVDKDTSSVESDTSSSVADSSVTSSSSKVKETSSATKAKEKSSSSKAKDSSSADADSLKKSSSSVSKTSSSSAEISAKSSLSTSSENLYTYIATGSLSIDESQKLIEITLDAQDNNICVIGSDGSASWKEVKIMGTSIPTLYEFHGDTLVTYDYNEDYTDDIGDLFIGGTSGNIYGTWNALGCVYYRETSITDCDIKTYHYTSVSINFSPEIFTRTAKINIDRLYETIKESDIMSTFFMYDVYRVLHKGNGYIEASDIYYKSSSPTDLQTVIKNNEVTILSNSNMNQTFTIGSKTFTVSVLKIEQPIIDLEHNMIDTYFSVAVTDGQTTCQLDYTRKNVTQDLCKAEYKKFFFTQSVKDINGNEYTQARTQDISNEEEFNTCVKSIAIQ